MVPAGSRAIQPKKHVLNHADYWDVFRRLDLYYKDALHILQHILERRLRILMI